ncbi:aspartate kinase [Pseudalkalibacillus salsuginis]|uniref:aspartate kinase n=1 Tax=Pseudalkalibacillus salsuginis TaxID=2910972 RepID=UPI001F295250|nr:aspartate kinase [Pseudalkalibacillus salsuginis]MCF6410623.1 aspartate kinase [Pseudalkalibacillus salsuginis]
MNIVVQKFGGTSLKTEDGRNRAVQHVYNTVNEGKKVVVVVSAMGRKGDPYATDTLLSLITGNPTSISPKETDLLMSCGEVISSVVLSNLLKQKNIQSLAFTGAKAGFKTNAEHTNAKIVEMDCKKIVEALGELDVVVVAGFQGQSTEGDVTTLGRGGSDTSAAALGAALKAEVIDIFTDVEGVMTADPRIVKAARPLGVVTYNEICNMAYQGAKVIHPRAVEIAMQSEVPIRIRSTYSDHEGTLVTSSAGGGAGRDIEDRLITGIAHVPNVTQIKVHAPDGDYDFQSKIFKAMAEKQISVDFINISPRGVIYTIHSTLTDEAVTILKELGYDADVQRNCAKISAVGAGIAGVPGVTAKIVGALSKQGINILQSADSHTTIWVLVQEEDMINAVNALHQVFELEQGDRI